MLASYNDKNVWYVVFTSTDQDHWIYKFIDRQFGHVYAVKSINDYQWLVIQPRVNVTQAKIMLKSQYPHIRDLVSIDDRVIKVSVESTKSRGALNWFSCVEQVKALIGVKSFWTLTPKQLYKGLLRGRYG